MNILTITKNSRLISAFSGVLFILIVASISHLLFSHIGLNPTDDGFVLAGSRRIIEGQIPHRDFIWFHTTASLFIHAPIVLFGGDYVFLISRYIVWIQFASIAWIWTVITARSFNVLLKFQEKFAVALVAFIFSVHYFPIMAWHTIDGLFFVSLGVILCDNESSRAKLFGYIILGIAPLCKQVFIPMIPLTILLFDDWRQLKFWITSIIPLLVYSVYLITYGAISDAIIQLTTHKNFYLIAIAPYVTNLSVHWGIIVGGLAIAYSTFDFKQLVKISVFQRLIVFLLLIGVILSAIWSLFEGSIFGYLELIVGGLVIYLLYSTYNFRRLVNTNIFQRLLGFLVLFGIIIGAAWTLANGSIFGYFRLFHLELSFGIFGAVIGVIIYFIAREQELTSYLRCGTLAVGAAWCTSLSIGWNSPALATGPLILFLIATVPFSCSLVSEDKTLNSSKNSLIRWILSLKNVRHIINILLIIVTVSSLIAFGIVRQEYIYREQPASHLTYDLGDVLPGAKGIKTNKNTYDFLKDLQNAKNIAEEMGKKYCIIPDVAANWVKDSQSNPLPSDWPQNTELGRKELLDRAIGDLEKMRGTIIVIVQKYEAASLAGGFVSLGDSYKIVNYVHSHFYKIGETQYFELYE